jgi:hypothetical protein
MLQTFPKHQAGWSETVVNVPAAATSVWSDLVSKNKSNYFYVLFFYLKQESYICGVNQLNPL